ncbi:MDR family MFS transporter [Streptomyces sp. RFCAC02]|uniref:MDR family MFS transporter n=1 Tax=Streptomyces sp. RFCAC02 TaxID=2499143 RepID=UPI00101F165A|nr:MDR family MFS transporter [Streptomyces sp. RFCAC02]
MNVTDSVQTVPQRRLNLISFVLVLGTVTTLLDTTIVAIALDHLRTTFDASVAATQWVATGYLLAFVSVIPVSGWLSERLGARRTWMLAVAAFLAGSVLCGLSWSLPALIVFRVLQGAGGGLVLPVTISILTRAAGPHRIGQAMAAIALPGQLAPVLGPVIGGTILDRLDWHWLFYVNVPLCLAALALAPALLPGEPGRRGHTFDLTGFLLLTPAVTALALGVGRASGTEGFAAPAAWAPLAAGAVLLTGFIVYARRASGRPLLDVRVFARRSFGLSGVITFFGGFSTFALSFLLPLYYQQVRGESVLHTGFLLIPQGLGTMSYLLAARRLPDRADGRLLVAAGVLLTMAGIVPFTLADPPGTAVLLAAQFVQGVGMGACTVPVMALAFAGLHPDEVPRGSAAFSVVQRVGAPFGVAVVAAILQSALHTATTPAGVLAAFTGTFRWTLALGAVPLLLALFLPRDGRRRAGPSAEPDL